MEIGIALAAAAMLVVAGAAALGPRLGIPAPLILVVLGVVVSLFGVGVTALPPELVLAGVLPPLLYASSVSLPAMDLRREFGTVSILSVVLVVVSALLLGGLFTLLIPGLPYAWGVALGAVVSPTDAVATSIVKGTPVSHRVTAILEGESLLNDASALVILRAAIAGAAGAVSFGGVVLQFAWAVLGAVVIGAVVGRLSLWLRARITDPTVSTVLSFTVPFVASLPAEGLRASGLVAAVAAGLVVGRRAPRVLSPRTRQNDANNWSSVSLVLEGAVFLLMGLQIAGIVDAAGGAATVGTALGLAAVAVVGTLVVRTAFVAPLLGLLAVNARRGPESRQRVERMQRQLESGEPVVVRTPLGRERRFDEPRGPGRRPFDRQGFQRRITQVLADIDYLASSRLGPKEGAVIVWAGMRGAVTVAAAQTIPEAAAGLTEDVRNLLVLVAFGTAALSLLLQGGTLAVLIRRLRPATDDPAQLDQERRKVLQLAKDAAAAVPAREGESPKQDRLRRLQASRAALLDARDLGVYDSAVLGHVLATVDSGQITLEMQGGPAG
ncbi:cation:proton antiporter [Amnibacterium endophyticum]|uniref:Cation:proton antiporter n=1 Tax=Amnibacterium endophyticum TaxID=2109337 RepID=A0ABW4LEE8_9MICO